MPISKVEKIWMDGGFVDWNDANIHILSPTLLHGWGVFEGIRAYESKRGPAVFRLTDHMRRLHRSARILMLDVPYTVKELVEATKELIRVNNLVSCYIRPIVFLREGEVGINPLRSKSAVAIIAFPLGMPHGAEGTQQGIRVKISSYQLIDSNAVPAQTKATGRYINPALAKVEALRAGYDDALLLNSHGYVAEATTLNIFIVRDEELITPPISSGALAGITQDSVRRIATDQGRVIRAEEFTRAELYTAGEAFLTGTAAEIVPIRSIDDRDLGEPGPITKKVQEAFFSITHGEIDSYSSWLEYVSD